MDHYFARICWNSRGWESPTGEAKHLEIGSYVAKDGFGHEEWLFNFTWLLNDNHYAFLQPINNSFERMSGQTIGVFLWAIDPQKQRVHIGEIKKCHVLTIEEARQAYDDHKRRGWIKIMRDDLAAISGNQSKLTPDSLFNVRFRPEDVLRYEAPYPVAKPTESIARFSRYKLVAATTSDLKTLDTTRTHNGSSSIPVVTAYSRSVHSEIQVNPHHAALQAELLKLLQSRHGKENVKREEAYVDLTIRTAKAVALLEIKPYASAKQAIREALGQILEYAFWGNKTSDPNLKLFVIAPAIADRDAKQYIDYLRREFHIPVSYCRFSLGCELPDDLKNL